MTAVHWFPAYVGIGSNQAHPERQVEEAIVELADLPDTVLALQSGRYASAPVGPQDQPDFINAVVALVTQLGPRPLLGALQEIERRHGRKRGAERWGPRTLDLDLLSYASQVSDEAGLTLPHPRIAERNFVLFPWREIAPHYFVPGKGTVAALATGVTADAPRIRRID